MSEPILIEQSRLSGNNYDIVIFFNTMTGEEHSARCKPGTLEPSDYEEREKSPPSRFET